MRILQSRATPRQAIRAGEKLLALFKLLVGGVVGVARAEEGGAVRGEGLELALCAVNVGFAVAEMLFRGLAAGGGDVGDFELHGADLDGDVLVESALDYTG